MNKYIYKLVDFCIQFVENCIKCSESYVKLMQIFKLNDIF